MRSVSKPKESDMNRAEAAKLIAVLQAHAPNHPVTAATIEMWVWVMDDIPYQAAQYAVREWITYHKWFPTPAELRGIIAEALTGLPSADEAWRIVQERIKETYPGIEAPAWNVPRAITDAVASMGGTRALRTSEKPIQDQRRFELVYGTLRDRALRDIDIPATWGLLQESDALPAGAARIAAGDPL